MFGFAHNKIIGLEVDEGLVVACVLVKKGRTPALTRCSTAATLEDTVAGGIAKEAPAFIALPAQIILFKSFYIPAALSKSRNQHRDIMAFLVRQNLPLKLEECFWDTFIWSSNLTLIAAKKEMVEKNIAHVNDAGLMCAGVTVAASALYNVFILNYPERKNDRCVLLHIRNAASDLVLYEPNHLWMYPLSIGKKDFGQAPQTALNLFSELERTFNAHTSQHPQAQGRPGGYFYLSGRGADAALADALKKHLPDYQMDLLDPLRKIPSLAKDIGNPSEIALAVGIGLSAFGASGALSTNMIRGKVSKAKSSLWLELLQKFALIGMLALSAALMIYNARLFAQLKRQSAVNKNIQEELASVVPQIKEAQAQQEKLKVLESFLETRIKAQMLYLKVLSTLAQSKGANVAIKEFSADKKDAQLEVGLSGAANGYNDINNFLANLKKNPEISNVKVVASTFPQGDEKEGAPIDFKVRFEVQL
jgi:hypothetical protein